MFEMGSEYTSATRSSFATGFQNFPKVIKIKTLFKRKKHTEARVLIRRKIKSHLFHKLFPTYFQVNNNRGRR